MIVIATHAVFLNGKDIYGPPHALSHYLNKNKQEHIFIKHPLDSKGESLIENYRNGHKFKSSKKKYSSIGPFPIRYVQEMIATVQTLSAYKGSRKCDIFVGVDPLNALVGVLLKRLGRVRKTVYFCADFAPRRFANPILNAIYHRLDTYAMFQSDVTWSISKRIVSYRRKKGLKNGKNLLLPNAPFFHDIRRVSYEKINRYSMVIVARLAEGIAYETLIDVVGVLQKHYPDVQLSMIGGGPLEGALKAKVRADNLEKHVHFLGPLSHEDMFKVLVKSGLGIALYNYSDPNHYHYYSDSMKVRDYLASGLPVVISGNSAIVDEVQKSNAGVNVTVETEDIVGKIREMFRSESKYRTMRENALKLAEEYDTESLIERYLLSLD